MKEANSQFFGMDLSRWPGQWRAATGILLDWPLFRRLLPQTPVQLHRPDGQVENWVYERGRAWPGSPGADARTVTALALPADTVLQRRMVLPSSLTPDERAQAVALDVASASPFEAAQTVWAYTSDDLGDGRTRIQVALASRAHIEQVIEAQQLAAEMPEIWVFPQTPERSATSVQRPIVLPGFGENRRQTQARRQLSVRLTASLLLLLLALALLLSPVWFKRMQTRQAENAFHALQQQAVSQLQQREAFTQNFERLQQMAQRAETQMALAPVLKMLTETLPDGAWLSDLRLEGRRLIINGQADDAAALVQRLSAETGTHNVHLASPATRRSGASKESFIIEMTLDADPYGRKTSAAALGQTTETLSQSADAVQDPDISSELDADLDADADSISNEQEEAP